MFVEYPKCVYRNGTDTEDMAIAMDRKDEARLNEEGYFEYGKQEPFEKPPDYDAMNRDQLRDAYEAKFGQPASGRMSNETLISKLSE